MHFLTNYDTNLYNIQIRASDYLSFAAVVLLAVTIVFEVPIVDSRRSCGSGSSAREAAPQPADRLLDHGGVAVALPGVDPVTTMIEMIPLMVLFEGSIWLSDPHGAPRVRAPREATLIGPWHAQQSRPSSRPRRRRRAAAKARARVAGGRRARRRRQSEPAALLHAAAPPGEVVYVVLAVLFAITFAFLGVGSGTNGGLDQLFSGLNIFGGGGTSVSKAQKRSRTIRTRAKGYRDLATAYEAKGDTDGAIIALSAVHGSKPKDADAWSELGGLQFTQAQNYLAEYQERQHGAQLAAPSTPFLPDGQARAGDRQNPIEQAAASAGRRDGCTDLQQRTQLAYNERRRPRTDSLRSSSRTTRTPGSSWRRRAVGRRHEDGGQGLQALPEAQPGLAERGARSSS